MSTQHEGRLFSALALALFASALACGEASPAEESWEEALDRIVAAECEPLTSCACDDGRRIDAELCEHKVRVSYIDIFVGAAEAGLTVDPECIAEKSSWDTTGCQPYSEIEEEDLETILAPPPWKCGACSVAYGDRQVGETCTTYRLGWQPSDCAQGLLCVEIGDEERCIDPCTSEVGSPCTWGSCGPGLYCGDSGCAPRLAAGEPCSSGVCAEGLLCSNEGMCKPKAGAGAPCYDSRDCELGHFCEEGTEVCRAALDPGSACDSATYCSDGRCEDGLCVLYPDVGEPCPLNSCAPGATCDDFTGVCVPEQPWVCEFF